MKTQKTIFLAFFSLFIISCGANKIVYPTQIEYTANPQLILDEFIAYIESQGYKIINANDTRMTLRNQNGFFTAEYLETEWFNSGVYDEPTGKEFIIKQRGITQEARAAELRDKGKIKSLERSDDDPDLMVKGKIEPDQCFLT